MHANQSKFFVLESEPTTHFASLSGNNTYKSLSSSFTRYSPSTLIMEVVSYRDIQPGEELSISCKSAFL